MQLFCSGKAISITYSECVFVALGIQRGMRCAILLSKACPALQYFSTLSHKRPDFRGGGVIEHKLWAWSFSTSSSETFFILRRI